MAKLGDAAGGNRAEIAEGSSNPPRATETDEDHALIVTTSS
jgi:hypothetical protein